MAALKTLGRRAGLDLHFYVAHPVLLSISSPRAATILCGAANHGCRRPSGGALFSALRPFGGAPPRPRPAPTPGPPAAAGPGALYFFRVPGGGGGGRGAPAQPGRSPPRLDLRFF